jgi:hypothetical protein
MAEKEWLEGTDPSALLGVLKGRASVRKCQLYLCGGCRHIAHLFFRRGSLTAVEVAERFADGEASIEELERAEWAAELAILGFELENTHLPDTDPWRMDVVPRLVELGAVPEAVLSRGEWQVDERIRLRLGAAAELAMYCALWSLTRSESEWQARLSRRVDWPGRWLSDCVFGNPFRPVQLNPSWLTPAVCSLSRTIYDERRFEDLPILADALEEAGCLHSDILNHCRGPRLHVRGCWAVDLVLGKD